MVEVETAGGVRRRRTGGGSILLWTLRYAELADAEALAIERFYADRGGALKPFEFVDPFANALADSTDISSPAWSGNTGGVTETEAFRERQRVCSMSAGSDLTQNVEVAGGLPYCASAWARSAGGSTLRIDLAGNVKDIPVGPAWKRCWVTMAAAGATGVVPVTFMNGGAGTIEIAAFAVEAQPYPGDAPRSGEGKSLYRHARFAEEGFRLVPTGPNRNEVYVTIEAVIEDEP
jgi:hypothetical protein